MSSPVVVLEPLPRLPPSPPPPDPDAERGYEMPQLQPSQATINKMLVASQAGNTTPTSAPATTVPVTVPINSSTTTTTPSTTTTAK